MKICGYNGRYHQCECNVDDGNIENAPSVDALVWTAQYILVLAEQTHFVRVRIILYFILNFIFLTYVHVNDWFIINVKIQNTNRASDKNIKNINIYL